MPTKLRKGDKVIYTKLNQKILPHFGSLIECEVVNKRGQEITIQVYYRDTKGKTQTQTFYYVKPNVLIKTNTKLYQLKEANQCTK